MPNMPTETTLIDLAREVGATADEIEELPSEVKQLTKGELLALWGSTTEQQALDAYQQSQSGGHIVSPASVENAGDAPLHLTLKDVSAIQHVFTPERVRAALGSPGAGGGVAQPADSYYCCCSPCCTSASTMARSA